MVVGSNPQLDRGHAGAINPAASRVTTAAIRLLHISAIVCLFKDKLHSQPTDSGFVFIHTLCAAALEYTIQNDVTRCRKSKNVPLDTEEYSYRNLGVTR